MAKTNTAKPATKVQRGRPWSRLANAMIAVGKPLVDAEQVAWAMWFEYKCPKTWEKLSDDPEALKELYEQLSGQSVEVVDDEEEDEEEEEESPPNDQKE